MGKIPLVPERLCNIKDKKIDEIFLNWIIAVSNAMKEKYGVDLAIPENVDTEDFFNWMVKVSYNTDIYLEPFTIEEHCFATEVFLNWMTKIKEILEA